MERKRATVNRYVCQERGEVFFPVDEESNLDRGKTGGGREGVRTNEFLRLILGSCSRINDISAIVGNLADPFYEIFFTIFFVNFFGSGSITGWTILISSFFSK